MGRQKTLNSASESVRRPKSGKDENSTSLRKARAAAVTDKSNHLAPRSGDLFRIGPPIGKTIQRSLIKNSAGEVVKPVIVGRIDRGFDFKDDNWIGYRRNYFSLVAGFHFENQCKESAFAFRYFIASENEGGAHILVKHFVMELGCECPIDLERQVSLIQNTAKRDNGPQSIPQKYNVVPGDIPSHEIMKLISNIRNSKRISDSNRHFQFDQEQREKMRRRHPNGLISGYPRCSPVTIAARYDRIQFHFAGNGPHVYSSRNNQRGQEREHGFYIKLVLYAVLYDGRSIEVAASWTPPLIIRGRSPSSYTNKPRSISAKVSQSSLLLRDQKGLPNSALRSPIVADEDNHGEGQSPTSSISLHLKLKKNNRLACEDSSIIKVHGKFARMSYSLNKDRRALVVTIALDPLFKDKEKTQPETPLDPLLQQEGKGHFQNTFFIERALGSNSIDLNLLREQIRKAPWPLVLLIRKSGASKSRDPFQTEDISTSTSKSASFEIEHNSLIDCDWENEWLLEYPFKSRVCESNMNSFERLDQAMRVYDATKFKLSALDDSKAPPNNKAYEWPFCNSSSILNPQYTLDQASSSTPQRALIPRCSMLTSFVASKTYERCCHGMKKRSIVERSRSFDDEDFLEADDSSFIRLKKNLDLYRDTIKLTHNYTP